MEKSFIQIKSEAIEQIQTVFDPEIPVNVYELGLIYDVNVDPMNNVHILMTLTSPSCPAAGSLPGEIEGKVRSIEGVGEVEVEITFDPPWSDELMTSASRKMISSLLASAMPMLRQWFAPWFAGSAMTLMRGSFEASS